MGRKLEILAPAGSFESLKAAVMAGADAVYMGGSRFGARAYADNPEGDRLLEAIDYAHLYGVKLYLTINTLLKEQELREDLYDYLLPCYEHGLDAVIIQDMGVMQAVREWFPDLPVHASTQMTLCGSGGVQLLKEAGVQRVVLARELSLAEIARIHQDTGMELECFVHGALCYCYSGQCLFSSILGGRSGNRGRCAQPCRLAYEAEEGQKVLSPKGTQTLLSPKDICAIDLIPQIAESGVCSLKIEGRMKRPEYTAGIVRIYRKYVDRYLQYGKKDYRVSEADKQELMLLFNRDGFSGGYYMQHNGRNMMALSERKPTDREKRAYEELILSLRREYVETEKKISIKGHLYAKAGDPLKLEITTAENDAETSKRKGTHGRTEPAGDKKPYRQTFFGECPQLPRNRSMEAEQLEKQMRKTGNTPFEWTELCTEVDGPLFVPVQALNSLRREALGKLQEEIVQSGFRTPGSVQTGAGKHGQQKKGHSSLTDSDRREMAESCRNRIRLHISLETEEQLLEVLAHAEQLRQKQDIPLTAVYVDAEGMEEGISDAVERIHREGLEAFVVLPAVFRMKTAERYEKKRHFWSSLPADGYVLKNLEEYEYIRRIGWEKEMILDHNVYTFNTESRRYWREKGVRMQTGPLELNSRELTGLLDEDSIQIIYGRYPMMVTAGCLHKTLDVCRRREEVWYLKDRYQKKFPVKNFCRDCYNIIYNSQPVYLLDCQKELRQTGVGAYRIMFTTEKKEEVDQVLAQWAGHEKARTDFTRGHWKRGVE